MSFPVIKLIISLCVLSALAPQASAYYYGAGACPEGKSAMSMVSSPHFVNGGVSQSQINGTLASGNLTVSLDSVPLTPGTPASFSIGKNHIITLKRSKGSYKGLLIRLAGYGTQALSYDQDDTGLQIAAVCITHYPNPVSGITHTDRTLKTETNAILRVDTPVNKLPLDVTVVIRNDGVSEFYYSSFILNAVRSAPTFAPIASTSSAPMSPTKKPSGPPVVIVKVPSGSCFSGVNTVEVQDKGIIFMKDLRIGDRVKSTDGKFDMVYSFGHYEPSIKAVYLQIQAEGLSKPLEISSDHLLFVRNNAVPASQVKIGDEVDLGGGRGVAEVIQIKSVNRAGAFAPFTMSGTIMVSGFAASTYVTLLGESNVFVVGGYKTSLTMHWLAHVAQTPHRLFCRVRMDVCSNERYTADGISELVARSLQFSQWLLRQHWVVKVLVFSPVLLLCCIFFTLEKRSWFAILMTIVAAAPTLATALRHRSVFMRTIKGKVA